MSPETGGFAVVLNRNAKKVTEKIEEISGELVHPQDLFLSSSAEDSEKIAQTLIERGYEAVFAGGGDGTVMHLINQLARYPLEQQPVVGILKLGTGNAMARMVSSGNLAGDLQTYIRSETRDYLELSLVEADGQRFPFAGLGIDAEILNDYKTVKENVGGSVMAPVVQSVGGYFLGIFTRTIPRRTTKALRRVTSNVKAVVTKGRATRLGAEGKVLEEFGPGDLLYDGPVAISMVGTVPFYGYGMKVLPFATNDPERMHLRISTIGSAKALYRLPSIWKGEYVGKDIIDFLVQGVELTFAEEIPYQVGGDAAGYRTHVSFDTVPRAVRLLRLL